MRKEMSKDTQLLLFASNQPEMVTSKPLYAVQRNWKTPCEFPYCPQTITEKPISTYALNLKVGTVFSKNQYSSSIIVDFATSKDGSILWVVCQGSDEEALKPWSLAQVTYESNLFVHSNLGSFFKRDGADKSFILAQGLEWTGRDSIDDFT